MEKMFKKAVVVHSGGMDSSICLLQAIKDHGAKNVLSLSFSYSQRHSVELKRADQISKKFNADHIVIPISSLERITTNALMDFNQEIKKINGTPNTLVTGRNGLMARLAAIHAESLSANEIYMGVIEVEQANSGYRDCSRYYMDKMQEILRLDLDNANFKIKTPLVKMTKKETMDLAFSFGELEYLLESTISCYQGIEKMGCQKCPACELRNEGIREFIREHPEIEFSYKNRF